MGEDGVPLTPRSDSPSATIDIYQNNYMNRSVLHAAALSPTPSPTLLATLVKVMSSVDLSLLNESDTEGNTA